MDQFKQNKKKINALNNGIAIPALPMALNFIKSMIKNKSTSILTD